MGIFRYSTTTQQSLISKKFIYDAGQRHDGPNPTAMDNKNVFDDRWIKFLGIPALGLFIPNLSGMITNRLYDYPELLASYAFFTLVSYLVWQGNVWLMHVIRRRYTWSFQQYHKIIISLFLVNIVYSGAISAT